MTDLQWIIDQNLYAARDGRACPRAAVSAILNGVSLLETETVLAYTNAMNAMDEICKDEPKLCEAVHKMMLNIIEDEGNHNASTMKASALFQGIKAPKPSEYQEAKNEG